jgi:Family of unknown function (DUF6049)
VLVGALLAAPAAAAPAQAAAAPELSVRTAALPADPVSVGVAAISPLVLVAGDTLRLTGVLTNRSTGPLTNLSIQLRLSNQPVTSRSELASLAVGPARPPGDLVTGALERPPDVVPAGGTLAWSLQATTAELGLSSPGVYPVAVEVIADDATTGGRTRYGTARTFLPWNLAGAQPTKVAVLYPVLGVPSRDANGLPIGTTVEDELDGRLGTLLKAVGGSHLTWLLDGDTLESVQQLADTPATPITSPTPTTTPATPSATNSPASLSGITTGTTSPGATATSSPEPPPANQSAADAQAWLATLRSDVTTGSVLAVPFGDPDLVATVRAGRTSDIAGGRSLGSQVVSQVLDGTVPVGDDVAWPADSTSDSRTLTALGGLGFRSVVLSSLFTPTVRAVTTYTPSTLGKVTGTSMTGAVSDSVLSTLLATPPRQLGGNAMAQQRILAELAMVTAEQPSTQRSVIIAPPRRWTPDADYIHGLLDALGQVPWVQPATLAELRVAATAAPARARPSYPAVVANREVAPEQFDGVQTGQENFDALSAIVPGAAAFRGTYTRALLRSESSVWRTARPAGLAYIHSVNKTIAGQVAAVRVVQSGGVTLAARSGKIPVTVENGLTQAVVVRLLLVADPDVRLTVTQPPTENIPAGESRTFEVAAEATTNGNVLLTVSILTPGGDPYGSPVTFPVQITGFGEVAQVIVGAAFVLLAVALVVRVARAIRRGRRPGSAASVRELVR